MRKAFIHLILIAFIVLPFQTVFALSSDYRFTGQELDRPTDLYYFDQRYYDPDVGKFTQPDPVLKHLSDPQVLQQKTGQDLEQFLSNPQNLNEYSYTTNNPVKYTDPEGEFSFTFIGAAVGSVAGMAYSYKNVYNYFNYLAHGNLQGASNEAESFLTTTGTGLVVGASIGMAIDTVIGAVGLYKWSSPRWQINNAARSISFKESSGFRYAQSTVGERFGNSEKVPEFLRGRTLDEVAYDIKMNRIKPSQISIDYIELGGHKIIDDAKSAVVLQKAGIKMSNWNLINKTDVNDVFNRVYSKITQDKLSPFGTKTVNY